KSLARRSTCSMRSRCLHRTRSGRWTTCWQRRISVTYRAVSTRRSTKIPSRILGCGSTPVEHVQYRIRSQGAKNRWVKGSTVSNAKLQRKHCPKVGCLGDKAAGPRPRSAAGQGTMDVGSDIGDVDLRRAGCRSCRCFPYDRPGPVTRCLGRGERQEPNDDLYYTRP